LVMEGREKVTRGGHRTLKIIPRDCQNSERELGKKKRTMGCSRRGEVHHAPRETYSTCSGARKGNKKKGDTSKLFHPP